MGSPCELLTEAESKDAATALATVAVNEVWRIEDKFSRYRDGNIVHRINASNGIPVVVDDETAHLLNFANTLFELSDGLFDITSGVLRRVWTFDGGNRVPEKRAIEDLLLSIGWGRASWELPTLSLLPGMEIDLGGIGKEYAVDRAVLRLRETSDTPCLVNLGGDLAVTGPPRRGNAWTIGIEATEQGCPEKLLKLRHGALATSGDARRFVEKDGVRYSHVLNPMTGWPVDGAAASITVAADTCVQAGMLSTLAMLKGPDAEAFLDQQSEQHWCRRRT
jgi:thiamine biosynthesis lipoprotein